MIRKVTKSDVAAITAIYAKYVLETTVSFETEAPSEAAMGERIGALMEAYPCYVYESEGKVVGYCYAHPWKGYAAYGKSWEATIYLAADAVGRGIGSELMDRLIRDSRTRGCHVLIGCITADNSASCTLCEKFGFQKVSEFREVGKKFGRWLDVVDYELRLD